MDELFTLNNAAALLALTSLEIILGIDNVVFLAILAEKLPERLQARARRLGLFLAMIMRIGLLFVITWVMKLEETLFTLWGLDLSGKDLVLIGGGLFLIYKAVHEIHAKLELSVEEEMHRKAGASFWGVIVQVVLLDAVFSLDSVITAVGMADEIWVMVTAVVISVGVMMIFAEAISAFIKRHPTTKMLALSFLLLIGVTLVVEGVQEEHGIDKNYIYSAMAFALLVEMLNLWAAKAKAIRRAKRIASDE